MNLKDSIKKEIQEDPDKKGYSKKTPEEIFVLINQPTVTKKDIFKEAEVIEEKPVEVPVGTKIGEDIKVKDAPVLRVINGIAGAPNVISIQDIKDALA